MLKTIDEKLFEQIFSHTLETLANKLINTTNKEENQIIVKNINKNKNKLYEQQISECVIQPSDWHIDLIDAIDLILNFIKNENENVNENDETLMSSDKDDGYEIIKILMHSDEYTKTTNQNQKIYNNKNIKWSFWQRSNKIIRKSRKSGWVLFYQRFWW